MKRNLLSGTGKVWCRLLFSLCAPLMISCSFAVAEKPAASLPDDPPAMYRLGMRYGMGDADKGLAPDYAQARHWLEQSAARDYPPAVHALAWLSYSGMGGARDLKEAVRLFSRGASLGDAESQYMLGILYLTGEGVEQNSRLAAQWLERAAAQGQADARRLLGALSGLSVAPAARQP